MAAPAKNQNAIICRRTTLHLKDGAHVTTASAADSAERDDDRHANRQDQVF
jgi:hypothetical protein